MVPETTRAATHLILREPPPVTDGKSPPSARASASPDSQLPHRALAPMTWAVCMKYGRVKRQRLHRCWPEEAAGIVEKQEALRIVRSILEDVVRNLPLR